MKKVGTINRCTERVLLGCRHATLPAFFSPVRASLHHLTLLLYGKEINHVCTYREREIKSSIVILQVWPELYFLQF